MKCQYIRSVKRKDFPLKINKLKSRGGGCSQPPPAYAPTAYSEHKIASVLKHDMWFQLMKNY